MHRPARQRTVPSAKPRRSETKLIDSTWNPARELGLPGDDDGDGDDGGAAGADVLVGCDLDGDPAGCDGELAVPQAARARAPVTTAPAAARPTPRTCALTESFSTVASILAAS